MIQDVQDAGLTGVLPFYGSDIFIYAELLV
jgi:hypothetical protein